MRYHFPLARHHLTIAIRFYLVANPRRLLPWLARCCSTLSTVFLTGVQLLSGIAALLLL